MTGNEFVVNEDDVLIDLINGTASYYLHYHSLIEGLVTGKFVFNTILTPMQEIEADKIYRSLVGEYANIVSTHVERLCYALSQLKVRVIEFPPFWSKSNNSSIMLPGSNLKDQEILRIIFEAAVIAEKKYREEIKKQHDNALKKLVENAKKIEQNQ